MQKHFDVTIPLACPHCLAEMFATLDEVEKTRTLQCSACGTDVELRPEDLARSAAMRPPEPTYFGIEF
jgi:transcription elongation factor Elf1